MAGEVDDDAVALTAAIVNMLSEAAARDEKKQAEEFARRHFRSRATVNLNALPSTLDTLNAVAFFDGRIRFQSVCRRGPMIIATTEAGREIVWPTMKDLESFANSRAIIADATDVFILPSDYRAIRREWDAAADKILQIAGLDAIALEPALKEETRDLIRMMWRAAGQPAAKDSAEFIDLMRAIQRSRRDANGETPPCVFLAEERCWLHIPTFRYWLSLPKFTNKLYPLPDIRGGLTLLGFLYQDNLTRGSDGDSERACLWRGPLETVEG